MLTKAMIETALNAEFDNYHGYDKHVKPDQPNSHNSARKKTLHT